MRARGYSTGAVQKMQRRFKAPRSRPRQAQPFTPRRRRHAGPEQKRNSPWHEGHRRA